MGNGTRVSIPAALDPATTDEVRKLTATVFETVDASGLARVAFFVERGSGRVYVNEINTVPGCMPRRS